jgi:hypothetical protein
MGFILVPTVLYGLLFLGQEFPATERVQQGREHGGDVQGGGAPLFLVLVFCMILTASTELATNQWIAYILSNTARLAAGGILVLVWINGLMAVGRWFAGPLVHRISPDRPPDRIGHDVRRSGSSGSAWRIAGHGAIAAARSSRSASATSGRPCSG